MDKNIDTKVIDENGSSERVRSFFSSCFGLATGSGVFLETGRQFLNFAANTQNPAETLVSASAVTLTLAFGAVFVDRFPDGDMTDATNKIYFDKPVKTFAISAMGPTGWAGYVGYHAGKGIANVIYDNVAKGIQQVRRFTL